MKLKLFKRKRFSHFSKRFTLPWIFGAHLLVLLLTVSLTIFWLGKGQSQPANLAEANNQNQVLGFSNSYEEPDLPPPPDDLHQLGILLLGYGGAGHQGGMLTDVIQIAYFDFDQKKVTLISIPRDLWVSLPNGVQSKVNKAFTLGSQSEPVLAGGRVSKDMMTLITGLDIKYFISVDFVGFQRLIGEVLGGIEVEVSEVLDDPWYPIKGEELNPCDFTPDEVAQLTAQYSGFELERQFTCRYEHLHYDPGTVKMEGGDALKFVRSRHGSAAGDFSRSSRQHAVLKGMVKKMMSLEAIAKAEEFYKLAKYTFDSDLDLEAAKYLAPAFVNLDQYQVNSVVLSTSNVLTSGRSQTGESILLPQKGLDDWSQVRSFIQSQL